MNDRQWPRRYRERLNDAVCEAALPAGRIVIDHAKGFKLFDPRTISHLEAEGNCTQLHFSDGKIHTFYF